MTLTLAQDTPHGLITSLKVKNISLMVLELSCSDLEEVDRQLQKKMQQGKGFFNDAPLVLDLSGITEKLDRDWLKNARARIAECHFLPVGITGVSEELARLAEKERIAVWPAKNLLQAKNASVPVPAVEEQAEEPVEEKSQSAVPSEPEDDPEAGERKNIFAGKNATAKLVQQTVRSGQRIYAEGGDLIVTASVNTGAEIMADGHIHVYGNLRGRALAGVKGWEDAKIFCHNLQADLVAVAGYYTINEDIPEDRKNKAVRISLEGETLNIDPIT